MDLLGDQAVLQNNALEGKTALICGASRGIGAATARIMAKQERTSFSLHGMKNNSIPCLMNSQDSGTAIIKHWSWIWRIRKVLQDVFNQFLTRARFIFSSTMQEGLLEVLC